MGGIERRRMSKGRWCLDLAPKNAKASLASPPGWTDHASLSVGDEGKRARGDEASLRAEMAMEVAQGQFRTLGMNCFMMWMAGNSIHIFPIMMVGMAMWGPISSLMTMKNVFEKFEGPGTSLAVPKLIFLAIHIAGVCA